MVWWRWTMRHWKPAFSAWDLGIICSKGVLMHDWVNADESTVLEKLKCVVFVLVMSPPIQAGDRTRQPVRYAGYVTTAFATWVYFTTLLILKTALRQMWSMRLQDLRRAKRHLEAPWKAGHGFDRTHKGKVCFCSPGGQCQISWDASGRWPSSHGGSDGVCLSESAQCTPLPLALASFAEIKTRKPALFMADLFDWSSTWGQRKSILESQMLFCLHSLAMFCIQKTNVVWQYWRNFCLFSDPDQYPGGRFSNKNTFVFARYSNIVQYSLLVNQTIDPGSAEQRYRKENCTE